MRPPWSVRSTDGVTLRVHELAAGPATGGDVLAAIHPTGFCGPVWAPIADRLSADIRVVAPSLRGHGGSTAPADGHFDWNGFAEDVLAVVDDLDLDPDTRLFGAGHSKGAAALVLAEQARPGTFGALWCYEPIIVPADPPIGPDTDNPLAARARRRREGFATRDEALANFASKPPMQRFHHEALAAYVEHGLIDSPDGSGVTLACQPRHEAQVYLMQSAHAAWRHLPETTCRIEVVCGEHSAAIGPALAQMLVDRLPNAELRVMEGWDHFGPLEDPARAAAEVSAWLSQPPDTVRS
ncbi:MAG TPA: alpha/beta hydrolase [Acidimicrobiales bacterium]